MSSKRSFKKNNGGLRRLIKREVAKGSETKTKVLDNSNSITDSARTTISNSLIDLDQGITQDTRIGNQIRVTSMKYDWFFTGADSTNSIRVIIYVPKDPNTVLSGVGFNQAPDLDQFTILKDLFICTGGTGGNCVRRNGWIRFNRGNRSGMMVNYSDGEGTSVTKNNLMVYMVSDSLAVADPQVNGFVRIYYKD